MWSACRSTLSVWPPAAPNRCRPNPGAGGKPPAIAHAPRRLWNMSLFPPRHWRGGFLEEACAHRSMAGVGSNENLVPSRFAAVRDPAGFAGLEGFDAPSGWKWLLIEWLRGRKRADEILAFDPARRHAHRRMSSSTRPNCAGASSATYEEPGKCANSASPISRRAKLARLPSSTQPCASPLMDSFHPRTSGDSFLSARPAWAKHLVISTRPRPPWRPIRPERHIENSIATIRKTTHGSPGSNPVALPVLPSLPSSTTFTYATTLPRIVVTQ